MLKILDIVTLFACGYTSGVAFKNGHYLILSFFVFATMVVAFLLLERNKQLKTMDILKFDYLKHVMEHDLTDEQKLEILRIWGFNSEVTFGDKQKELNGQ